MGNFLKGLPTIPSVEEDTLLACADPDTNTLYKTSTADLVGSIDPKWFYGTQHSSITVSGTSGGDVDFNIRFITREETDPSYIEYEDTSPYTVRIKQSGYYLVHASVTYQVPGNQSSVMQLATWVGIYPSSTVYYRPKLWDRKRVDASSSTALSLHADVSGIIHCVEGVSNYGLILYARCGYADGVTISAAGSTQWNPYFSVYKLS